MLSLGQHLLDLDPWKEEWLKEKFKKGREEEEEERKVEKLKKHRSVRAPTIAFCTVLYMPRVLRCGKRVRGEIQPKDQTLEIATG